MAVLPVTKREVQYSFSVYETIRTESGKPVHLQDHLERLKASCRMIELSHPFSDEMISSSLYSLIEHDAISDASCRILIVGGPDPLFFITYSDPEPFPESYYSEGVPAILYYGERFMPEAKTSNLLMQYLAAEEAKREGAFEALLVDRHNQVLEGTRSNFYALMGGTMFTAPDDEVLSGVTRISVLRAAKELGIDVVMRAVRLEELENAGSMFISSTSMAAMPVSSLDGKAVPCDFPTILKIRDLVRKWEVE